MNELKFEEYLENLLGNREKNKLLKALKAKKAVVISGPHRATGKTTLANVLRDRGHTVYEKDLAVHEVYLTEMIKECVPNFKDTIV